jgi:hypothetical protein
MESKRLEVTKTTLNYQETTNLICKVLRYGDLISQMYLCLSIPNIYSNNAKKIKWVDNFGLKLIDKMEIYIGGSLIDTQYGEWIHIWNELTLPLNKRDIYNKMIGNTVDVYDPEIYNGGTYPHASIGSSTPSIIGRKILIPLNFWFNNNIGSALPLISLQYHEVEIRLELKALKDLYLLEDLSSTTYRCPIVTDVSDNLISFIDTTETNVTKNDGIITDIDIEMYMEANYIYLDNGERDEYSKNEVNYLIEQTTRLQSNYISSKNNTFTLTLNNPVKELIWVLKRSDISDLNDWFNFEDSDLNQQNIMQSGQILLNGLERIEDKTSEYFNLIQAYQHHGQTKNGIYLYSFSLKPNLYQPSGSCNMSKVNKIQLYLKLNEPSTSSYTYDLNVYSVSYNFLRIVSGTANIAFQL